MKFGLGSVGSLLSSVLALLILGPFPLWLDLVIFIVPLALTNLALAKRKPSSSTGAKKGSPLLSVIAIALLIWYAVDHRNKQRWLTPFDKGKAAFEVSDYSTAQSQFTEALALAQKSRNFEGVCKSQNYLGNIYLNRGEYPNAERELLVAAESCLSSGNAGTLVAAYASLGAVRQYNGDYQGAEGAIQKAMEVANKNLKPDDPQVATALNNLGALQQSEGKCTEAERSYRHAVDIWEHASNSDTGYLTSGYSNLGQVLDCEGEVDEAEAFYRKSVAVGERHYGPDSPELSPALNNLAMLYRRKGEPDEAKKFLERAIANLERQPTPDKTRLGTMKKNYQELSEDSDKSRKVPPR